jgi:hypothetical protein
LGVLTAGTVLGGVLWFIRRQVQSGDIVKIRVIHDLDPETRRMAESYHPILTRLSEQGVDVNMRLFRRRGDAPEAVDIDDLLGALAPRVTSVARSTARMISAPSTFVEGMRAELSTRAVKEFANKTGATVTRTPGLNPVIWTAAIAPMNRKAGEQAHRIGRKSRLESVLILPKTGVAWFTFVRAGAHLNELYALATAAGLPMYVIDPKQGESWANRLGGRPIEYQGWV